MLYDERQRPVSQNKTKFIILTSNKNSLSVSLKLAKLKIISVQHNALRFIREDYYNLHVCTKLVKIDALNSRLQRMSLHKTMIWVKDS